MAGLADILHYLADMAPARSGWRLTDAFETRWLARPEAAIDELASVVLR